ncbi:kinase-like protein [Trichodelitschia bisporula]|uniref:Kinase-like protein n=1 Tax=Trichodelitschia bisporula TaxID=703511 RepID=A0A6G1HK46_9PEZI|nr:kinase-like protein [Trichodelitschia bisporula]
MRGASKEVEGDFDLDRSTSKQFRAKVARRLSGRPSIDPLPKIRAGAEGLAETVAETTGSFRRHSSRDLALEELVTQVHLWLHQQKSRRAAAKAKRATGHHVSDESKPRERRASDASESSLALDQLQEIIDRTVSAVEKVSSLKAYLPRRPSSSSMRKLRRTSTAASSDTEHHDVEFLVPSCHAILDNTKTLLYSAGGTASDVDITRLSISRPSSMAQNDAWGEFKFEIVRLAHTLRLKGWRKVPLESSDQITVQRLSGALTNAVYVVSPPKELTRPAADSEAQVHVKPPPKLLLRIYGTNADHLIDREGELHILVRLAKKRIGPRLLGTFTNGRFEEFLDALPLTPPDLRDPAISKQIAKRMRELHDGIELLPEERAGGPFVLRNIDKWMDRCARIAAWVDENISRSTTEVGFVCGTDWNTFQQVFCKYREWLQEQYGGVERVKDALVFAHNDTQYGNILRLMPSGESPLLLPENEHKRLVVIDFEYANANPKGLEFANHFSEWCYDYHDATAPYACSHKRYPTTEEQIRFIKAYVAHRPVFPVSTPGSATPQTPYFPPTTPALRPSHSTSSLSTSLISNFMLDMRFPQAAKALEDDEQREREIDQEVQRLLAETRLWRMANSAQWVMWGILQAKVPEMPNFDSRHGPVTAGDDGSAPVLPVSPPPEPAPKEGEKEDADAEFDYLGYAQDRAMLFWGDAVALGLVKLDELPEKVRQGIKIVPY